ncbi:diguanylate cyclase (GGDEF) domain-containing protein [Legionella quinlivanii DSM 21216]|uniref:GGDEF domain-containing protein n=2 Tax=Legionella quinlivanii TaxID=45073 RepID=UPI00089E3550|nr:GGDEF domain-containing protein [Legionella quinlivanii]SEG41233.1 diguanylate cyclase (GGDEF) domain-containing protein [Legionella quinlivanii DSM 21216]
MKPNRSQLQDECFLLLLESSLRSIPFNGLLSVLISFYLLYRQAPLYWVMTWLLAVIFLSIARLLYSKYCIKSKRYIKKKKQTLHLFIALTFLMGALWGSSYLLFYPYFLKVNQNIITLVLGGMAAGALASLSVYLPAYCAYLLPMFLPLIVYNYWLGEFNHSILATMFSLFVLMLLITAKSQSRILQSTIRLTQEKEKALIEIKRLSITDSLTGLYNRRYFDQRLSEEFARAKRNHHPINLVLIDVDDFKRLNDNFGHPSGDLFLKHLASAIKKSAQRANDTSFRIGGDEFATILTNTSLEEAILLCRKLQNKVQSEISNATTLSIGIVSVSPSCPEENVEQIISVADKTLYEAKKSGKNQVRAQQLNCL